MMARRPTPGLDHGLIADRALARDELIELRVKQSQQINLAIDGIINSLKGMPQFRIQTFGGRRLTTPQVEFDASPRTQCRERIADNGKNRKPRDEPAQHCGECRIVFDHQHQLVRERLFHDDLSFRNQPLSRVLALVTAPDGDC